MVPPLAYFVSEELSNSRFTSPLPYHPKLGYTWQRKLDFHFCCFCSAMADASKNSGSVTQPARLQLKELNTRSAKIGSWEVACFHPKMDEWSWTDKNTQQTKQGAAFRCLLVSLQDPSQYVAAQLTMRSANRDPLEAAEKRFIENTAFLMTSAQFQTNVKQEYMHTPLKCIVQIAGSKFDPLMKIRDDPIIQA